MRDRVTNRRPAVACAPRLRVAAFIAAVALSSCVMLLPEQETRGRFSAWREVYEVPLGVLSLAPAVALIPLTLVFDFLIRFTAGVDPIEDGLTALSVRHLYYAWFAADWSTNVFRLP